MNWKSDRSGMAIAWAMVIGTDRSATTRWTKIDSSRWKSPLSASSAFLGMGSDRSVYFSNIPAWPKLFSFRDGSGSATFMGFFGRSGLSCRWYAPFIALRISDGWCCLWETLSSRAINARSAWFGSFVHLVMTKDNRSNTSWWDSSPLGRFSRHLRISPLRVAIIPPWAVG
jgi:hypothetical protein